MSGTGRRARDLGIPLDGTPGALNAITDVAGVEVGFCTLVEGASVRTGVTVVHPRGRAGAGDPCAAGVHLQNGNGEMTGLPWIVETGTFAGPVCLTNTHAVGVAHAGVVRWTVREHPRLAGAWLLPVVSETWDGYLNDINGAHVREAHVLEALDGARDGPVAEGAVGGGTGMCCYDLKGGTGTASRVVGGWTVGVLLQANFGDRDELTVAGRRVGPALPVDNPMAAWAAAPPGAGSVVAIVACDAPLLPHQCAALARRVTAGLARTGTSGSHFSGDLFLALSTANPGAFAPAHVALQGGDGAPSSLAFLPWSSLDPLFAAVVQATEEAVLNALAAGEDTTGHRGHRVPGLPADALVRLLA